MKISSCDDKTFSTYEFFYYKYDQLFSSKKYIQITL